MSFFFLGVIGPVAMVFSGQKELVPKIPSETKESLQYVFQSLHKINYSSVTDKLTRLIRGLVSTELKAFFSSR